MKTLYVIALILVMCANVPAIYIAGTHDPLANAGTPEGVCGRNSQVAVGTATGTIIGSHHVLTAKHLNSHASVGGTVTYGTQTYTIVDVFDSPTINEYGEVSKHRVLKVDCTFTPEVIAPLNTGHDELGKQVYMFGRGPKRGSNIVTTAIPSEYVLPISITGLTIGSTNVSITVTGGLACRAFSIEKSCGTEWHRIGTFTMPECGFTNVAVPKCSSPLAFFRAQASTTIVNGFHGGMGTDGVIRWGRNTIDSADGAYLTAHFDNNGDYYESYTGPGDSGGGVFINDDGIWKLAGVVEGGYGAWFQKPGDVDTRFWGPVWDASGLETQSGSETYTYPIEGGPKPMPTLFNRVSSDIEWLQWAITQ